MLRAGSFFVSAGFLVAQNVDQLGFWINPFNSCSAWRRRVFLALSVTGLLLHRPVAGIIGAVRRVITLFEHRAAIRAEFADVLLHTGLDLVLIGDLRAAKMHRVGTAGFFLLLFLLVAGVRVRFAEYQQGNQTKGKKGSVLVHIGSR
jgi:hypothetical protein